MKDGVEVGVVVLGSETACARIVTGEQGEKVRVIEEGETALVPIWLLEGERVVVLIVLTLTHI